MLLPVDHMGLERDETATRAADLWNPTARSMEALNL